MRYLPPITCDLTICVQSFEDDEDSVKFLNDENVKAKFERAFKLSDVSVDNYDAIFYVGGHGPAIDLAVDPVNAKLSSQVRDVVGSDILR